MKPAPHAPGNTEAERFDNAVRTIFRVPKAAVLKEGAKQKQGASQKETEKSEKRVTSS
jgi:hypothetical protein